MVLPVLALYGENYEGATASLLGLALGIYGLSQAALQIPLGILSDVWGRKPVIFLGLLIFVVGSLVAAKASTVEGLILGRFLQGAGAIAGAVMAMVADLTTDDTRTKAMAFIGASIGVSFGVALALGPWIASFGGMESVFTVTAFAAGSGILVLFFLVPPVTSSRQPGKQRSSVWATFKSAQLFRLNWGIFTLHALLMSSFVVVPGLLEDVFGVQRERHWLVYLLILGGSFLCILPLISQMERRGRVKSVFLFAIIALGASLAALALFVRLPLLSFAWAMLFLFFVAFNLLEATLPSLVSKLAPRNTKGTALGIYSTSQFLGTFVGGVLGGVASDWWGTTAVLLIGASMALIWLLIAARMRITPGTVPQASSSIAS